MHQRFITYLVTKEVTKLWKHHRVVVIVLMVTAMKTVIELIRCKKIAFKDKKLYSCNIFCRIKVIQVNRAVDGI
jgi:uncharacterized membrane protein YobD (UPF0266 family)